MELSHSLNYTVRQDLATLTGLVGGVVVNMGQLVMLLRDEPVQLLGFSDPHHGRQNFCR